MKKRSFVLFGHPVRQSISAHMFKAAFRDAGLPHIYSPVDVGSADALRRAVGYVRDGIYDGANITLPYKRDVLQFVDVVDESASRVGAANVIVSDATGKLTAHNTDESALVDVIGAVTGGRSRAAILGAGGAAFAAMCACKRLGFSVIGVTTRSWVDTDTMISAKRADRVRALGGLTAVWPSHVLSPPSTKMSMAMRMQWTELAQLADIVIQASSAGMLGKEAGDEVASFVPFGKMSKQTVALDLIYNPPKTPFLAKAEAAGNPAINGLGMLVRQAEATYALWCGEPPPPGSMQRAAELAMQELPAA